MKDSPFHIQQNLTPERLANILRSSSNGDIGIRCLVDACGLVHTVVERVILPFLRQIGLLRAEDLCFTELAHKLHRLQETQSQLLPEAVHQILATSYVFNMSKRFSWAYARVVDLLWQRGEVRLESSTISQIVGQVVQDAVDVFGVSVEKVAFSADSVRGVFNWLRALEPAVIEDSGKTTIFKRRYFCPIVAFLWAVDFLYKTSDTPHGVRLFLSPERSDQLCRLCVLDPSGLHNVVMMAKRTTDYQRGGVFDTGTEGGFGRWILLAKPFPVGEVL